jgi:hypothetical protein
MTAKAIVLPTPNATVGHIVRPNTSPSSKNEPTKPVQQRESREKVTRGTPESFEKSVRRVEAQLAKAKTKAKTKPESKAKPDMSEDEGYRIQSLLQELADAVNKAASAREAAFKGNKAEEGLMLNASVEFRNFQFGTQLYYGERVEFQDVLSVINNHLHDNTEYVVWLIASIEKGRLVFRIDTGDSQKPGREIAIFHPRKEENKQ